MASLRRKERKPSVFIGFTEVAGYFHNLRDGLCELGYPCDFVELVPHPFKYREENSKVGLIVSLIRFVRLKAAQPHSKILSFILSAPLYLLMASFFLITASRYDVFIFTYGNSFFNSNRDLALLKLLKKRIIMPFMGSEARPCYLDGFIQFSGVEQMYLRTQEQQKKLHYIERFVDVIVNNPAAGHLLEKPFVSGYCLGIPQNFEGSSERCSAEGGSRIKSLRESHSIDNPIRVLHSPSDQTGKGSKIIRQIIHKLKEKKYNIEYSEITRRPHSEVIEKIQMSDLVIDQVYSDTPMATFSSEAAWFGIPAVVGGYYAGRIENEVDREYIPPSQYVLPEDIESIVECLIVNTSYRLALGAKAQNFVRTRWSRSEVASRYAHIISNTIPNEWWFDPLRTTYLYGCGLSEVQVIDRVSSMIDRYGLRALGLEKNPDLERNISAMIEKEEKAISA